VVTTVGCRVPFSFLARMLVVITDSHLGISRLYAAAFMSRKPQFNACRLLVLYPPHDRLCFVHHVTEFLLCTPWRLTHFVFAQETLQDVVT